MRALLQLGFLALTLVAVFVVGGNAERWCPFGGVEALYTYVSEGNMPCSLGVSNFYILGAVLLMTLLLRRAFCGYACPIGAISEWVGRAAAHLGLRPIGVSPRVDAWLSWLKLPVLAVLLWLTYRAGELIFRGFDPCYALLSRHGEDITFWAYVSAGGILLASMAIRVPFCRWLCPLAAVLQPFSKVGWLRVRREAEHCVDCGRCAEACPMRIDVDRTDQVTAARCTSCLACIDACRVAAEERPLVWGPPRRWGRPWPRGVLAGMLLFLVGAAALAAQLAPLPSYAYERGQRPEQVVTVELELQELTCRGRCSLLVFFIDRDDEFALGDYVKLEAWPGPGIGRARITIDASAGGEASVRAAVTEPYFNLIESRWYASPFVIVGAGSP